MFNPFVPNVPQVEYSILAKIAKKIGPKWVKNRCEFAHFNAGLCDHSVYSKNADCDIHLYNPIFGPSSSILAYDSEFMTGTIQHLVIKKHDIEQANRINVV